MTGDPDAVLAQERQPSPSLTTGRSRAPTANPLSRCQLASRIVQPDLLDRVIIELRTIERRTGLERTLAIGATVLDSFFAGDPNTWRDRRRNKNNSIRRLAEREDCPFCKSALNDAVGVYVAVRELPWAREFQHVSASHITAVLRLSADDREQALKAAEQERWSVRQLREHVVNQRRQQGERRGRPAASAETQFLAALRVGLRTLEQTLVHLQQPETGLILDRSRLLEFCDQLKHLEATLRRVVDSEQDSVGSAPPEELSNQ